MAQRLILIRENSESIPAKEMQAISEIPGIRVLDSALGNMLLVEGDEETIRKTMTANPDWTVNVERSYRVPSPIPKVKSKSPRSR